MHERLMLRPSELAEAIGVSRSKGYEVIASGEIPSVRVGGCIRVPVDAVRAWIAQQLGESAAPAIEAPSVSAATKKTRTRRR